MAATTNTPSSPDQERLEREAVYRSIAAGELTVGQAVRRLRKLANLTQPEFAAHRGISLAALRQIERGTGNPTVETLAKIVSVFGLQVGFVPKRRAGAQRVEPKQAEGSQHGR